MLQKDMQQRGFYPDWHPYSQPFPRGPQDRFYRCILGDAWGTQRLGKAHAFYPQTHRLQDLCSQTHRLQYDDPPWRPGWRGSMPSRFCLWGRNSACMDWSDLVSITSRRDFPLLRVFSRFWDRIGCLRTEATPRDRLGQPLELNNPVVPSPVAPNSGLTPMPLFPGVPMAPVYYVATSGSDDNTGTLASPYLTLQRAIAQITDGGGGTIYVRGGTYQPSRSILIGDNTDGSANSRLVIRPYQDERVIIDGSRMTAANSNGFDIFRGSYVDIMGFEVQNVPGTGIAIVHAANVQILNNRVHDIQASGIGSYGSSDLISDRNANIRIDGNTVYRTNLVKGAARDDPSVNWGMGISLGFSDTVSVTNNRVYENYGEGIGFHASTNGLAARNVVYDNYALGIYLDNASNTVVDGNFIYNTGNPEYFRNGAPANGIQMANETYSFAQYDQSPYHLNNNQIINNIVVNVGSGIVYGTYRGFGNGTGSNFYGLRNTAIVNNTFYNPSNLFVQMDEDPNTSNVIVANNIFARASRNGLLSSIPSTSNITVESNLWSGGNQVEGNQSVLSGTNIQADPGLVNPGGFNAVDYQLRLGSAAIDAGSYRANVSTDYFGQLRPVSGIYDIGADEL